MTSRLTSAVFVSALIRRVNGEGGFSAILRRGAEAAGAIFICVPAGAAGGTTLYAQAPQSIAAERDHPAIGGRLFERIGEALTEEQLSERFAREARFDPDFWVVELELFGRQPTEYFDVA
ncbi:DUF1491 family protein [Oricola sp.]|uniref:DUF1491 family protein n=1 Tax=Oricola sp. TaxID=1979950 RepID=UPI0025DF33CB|nr:DUF1491 family protein [Oricola sp.]MCI5073531.1 DUF1491 family protein [Oricola sp.]